jgi:voltage-gated potassium channel
MKTTLRPRINSEILLQRRKDGIVAKPNNDDIYHKKRAKKFRTYFLNLFSNPVFTMGYVVLTIIVVTMLVIYIIEVKDNDNINGLFDTFWYAIVTLTTVGYGDISPVTLPGRLFGLIPIAFGVVLVAALSGKIASFLVDLQLRRGKGLVKLKNLQDHFIICGWRHDFEQIIDGVLDANPSLEITDIVLINNAPSEKMELFMANPKYKLISYIHGDFIDEAVLNRANIRKASKVMILADYSEEYSPVEIDSRTVMAVLTIEALNRNIYTAAELLDEKFEKYLTLAHCDEVILTKEYVRYLLVNASSGTGVSHIVRDLLAIQGEQNKISIEAIPQKYIGKEFKETFDYFIEKQSGILIGVLENTGNFFTRKKEALSEAQKTPDISKIVDNLKKVKELKPNNPVLNPGFEYILKDHSKGIVVRS